MSQTVIGIFKDPTHAQEAKSYLLANGFTNQNIDISSDNNQTGYSRNEMTDSTNNEGVGDRISDFFKNLFTDENEASSHISAARSGTIVTVHAQTTEEATNASEILNEYGAVDVNDTDMNHESSSFNTGNTLAGTTELGTTQRGTGEFGNTQSGNTDRGTTDKINVIKEDLKVGKEMVETGGVRLHSRIVERPIEQNIRLREEHINVERNTVDRPASDADFANFKEGTVELTENSERPVVTKNARVVEEVSLGKEVTERDETIRDTVRHTEVDTEKLDGDINKQNKI